MPRLLQKWPPCWKGATTARSLSDGWFDPWAMPGGFDPTGYVKGWAAQRALGALSMPGVTGAIVNAAGDVVASGRPGTGRPFRVAIVDPSNRQRFVCVVELEGGIATSGTYERGAHLIDPRTGQPASRAASASVTGPDLGLADALATALAVAGPAGLDFIEPIEGYEGFVIGYDGSWQSTGRFPFDTRPERSRDNECSIKRHTRTSIAVGAKRLGPELPTHLPTARVTALRRSRAPPTRAGGNGRRAAASAGRAWSP